MIIAKELIDASIKSKNDAQKAREDALWSAIESKMEAVAKLPGYIKDVMDTYRYVKSEDKKLGGLLWNVICHEDKELGLGFCNAITDTPGERCGVRPYYTMKCYYNLYVLEGKVLWGDLKNLKPLGEMKDNLSPEEYEGMLSAMTLLIETVPAYAERIGEKLKGML